MVKARRALAPQARKTLAQVQFCCACRAQGVELSKAERTRCYGGCEGVQLFRSCVFSVFALSISRFRLRASAFQKRSLFLLCRFSLLSRSIQRGNDGVGSRRWPTTLRTGPLIFSTFSKAARSFCLAFCKRRHIVSGCLLSSCFLFPLWLAHPKRRATYGWKWFLLVLGFY